MADHGEGNGERDLPDGLSHAQAEGRAGSLLVRLMPTLFLGAVIAVSFTGAFGGTPNPTYRAEGSRASLSANVPRVLRSGELFEMRFRIRANAPLADATLTIEQSYLHDLTLNTQIPTADKEEATDKLFRFSYGPLEAGEVLDIKLDGQVNPKLFLGTEGVVAVGDGEEEIARVPLTLTVLP
jgi:hypothetical protein